MSATRPLRAAVALAACLFLPACITVLPKAKPAQLYRFGGAAAAAASAASGPVLAEGRVDFDSAAATDRILTVSGEQTAYIAGARWVSQAPTLFEEALIRAFQSDAGTRLAVRGSTLRTAARLDLDVQSFEARYDQGPEAAPLVVVRLRAQVVRPDRTVAGEQLFEVDKRASDNRVGAIVQAYDAAAAEALSKLVAWTAGLPGLQAG